MAGPSIAVKVLADLKGFSSSFDEAGSKVQGVASKASASFGSFLSGINQTGLLGPLGGMLDGLNTQIGNIIDHAKKIGPALLGGGAALTGIGAGLSAFGSKEQASQQQLQTAIENTGGSYEDYAGSIEAAVGHQENFGHTADETMNALQKLTDATHDPQKALDLLGEASDIAATKHEDLTTAADQLGKVYNGNTKLLKPFGIQIDKVTGLTKDGKTAVQALADVTAGQASAAQDTFAGKLDVLKTKLEDMVAKFGEKWGPTIQTFGIALMGLGSAAEIAGAGFTAMGIGEDIALGPLLLIAAAVVAVWLAVVLLYQKWDEVWSFIGNLPWYEKAAVLILLLVNPVTALIIIAAALAVYWSDIWAGITAAVQWAGGVISATVNGIVGALLWLRDTAIAAKNWIVGAWDGIVSFFAGLPGRIASAASGMWDGISGAFRNMLNVVIGLWNGLHIPSFSIGGWSTPFGDLPSWDSPEIGFPQIQPLATGGIVTDPGLFLLHAGEAVTPADAVRSGPVVNIETANFTDDVDIDLFMRRVSWAVQSRAV